MLVALNNYGLPSLITLRLSAAKPGEGEASGLEILGLDPLTKAVHPLTIEVGRTQGLQGSQPSIHPCPTPVPAPTPH